MWLELSFETNRDDAAAASDYLEEVLGALSVTWEAANDAEASFVMELNAAPTWQCIKIKALFPKEMVVETLVKQLKQHFAAACWNYQFHMLGDQPWERTWLKDFRPMRFGQRLWVCPSMLEVPDSQAIVIRLDPGLAFGTGTHPSTALCLEWIDYTIQPGQTVIDYGCGSGILSIAAVKCGAQHVFAIDHDPQAIEATCANASANAISETQLDCCLDTQFNPTQLVDVLLANILAQPLLALAERFKQLLKPQGYCVLAGLLQDQMTCIKQHYQRHGFAYIKQSNQQEWSCLVFQRIDSL